MMPCRLGQMADGVDDHQRALPAMRAVGAPDPALLEPPVTQRAGEASLHLRIGVSPFDGFVVHAPSSRPGRPLPTVGPTWNMAHGERNAEHDGRAAARVQESVWPAPRGCIWAFSTFTAGWGAGSAASEWRSTNRSPGSRCAGQSATTVRRAGARSGLTLSRDHGRLSRPARRRTSCASRQRCPPMRGSARARNWHWVWRRPCAGCTIFRPTRAPMRRCLGAAAVRASGSVSVRARRVVVDGGNGGAHAAPPLLVRLDVPPIMANPAAARSFARGSVGARETTAFAALAPMPAAASARDLPAATDAGAAWRRGGRS